MFPLFLVNIVVALIIVGLVLWIVSELPLDPMVAKIIRVVVVVVVGIWLIYFLLGMAGPMPVFRR